MYIDKVNKAAETIKSVLKEQEIKDMLKEKEQVVKALEDCMVVKLPIIGIFNAGKTTLVNSILGADGMLPVNIVPETSIPCELYSVKDGELPHAEIYRGDSCIFNGEIKDYSSVKVEPGDCGKVFSSSPLVKEWCDKGIVLVDMPGYDSGIEEHNKAIGRYMSQGTVFAFLMNGPQGSLKASEITLLREVCQYGSRVGVFLTHIDLMGEERVREVKDYIEYQAESFLPKGTIVGMLSALENNNADFVNFVNSINVTQIIEQKSKPQAASFIGNQVATLKGLIALAESGSSQTDIEDKINDLKEQISSIENVINEGLNKADTPEKSTQDILDAARKAIEENAPTLADAIMQAGENGANVVTETLISVIRPALAKAFQEEQEQYIAALNAEISALTRRILDGIEVPTDVIEDVIGNNESAIVGYVQIVADLLQNAQNPIVRVVGQVLGFLAHHIPAILRSWFGGTDRARARLVGNIQGPIADMLIQGLRRPVSEQVRAQQAHIIEATRFQYEASLNKMKDMLRRLNEAKAQGEECVAAEVNKYKSVLNQLEEIYNGVQ